jgi:hypothetical protein
MAIGHCWGEIGVMPGSPQHSAALTEAAGLHDGCIPATCHMQLRTRFAASIMYHAGAAAMPA